MWLFHRKPKCCSAWDQSSPSRTPTSGKCRYTIADVEQVIQTNQNRETCDRNRCTIANQIQNYIHAERRGRKDASTNFFRSVTKSTKKFLVEHPNIVVIEADKGNKTVVMRREE